MANNSSPYYFIYGGAGPIAHIIALNLAVADETALLFYTDFTNPSKTSYSWNAALPQSFDAFTSGELAAYLGYASEYNSIISRNPNLRFKSAH